MSLWHGWQRRLQSDEYAATGKEDDPCPGGQFSDAEQEEPGQREGKLVGAKNGAGPNRLVEGGAQNAHDCRVGPAHQCGAKRMKATVIVRVAYDEASPGVPASVDTGDLARPG